MEFKKRYSEAELTDLLNWFEAHKDKLPDELQLDEATRFTHLKSTYPLYHDIITLHKDNPTYSAQIHQAFKIRDKLTELWQGGNAAADQATDLPQAAETAPDYGKA